MMLAIIKNAENYATVGSVLNTGPGTQAQMQVPGQPQHGGMPQHAANGMSTIMGLIQGLGGTLGGQAGADIATMGSLLLPLLGMDVSKLQQPIRVGYGGNAQLFQAHMPEIQEMQKSQVLNLGESLKRALTKASTAIPWVSNKLKDLGLNPNDINADSLGSIGAAASVAFPEARDMLANIDPSFISDYGPLLNATYIANGGKFSPQAFRGLVTNFKDAYAKGVFGEVPASIAAVAVPVAAQMRGGKLHMPDVIRLAQVADGFVKAGVPFGQALNVVQEIGPTAISNPDRVRQMIFSVHKSVTDAGMDPQFIGAAIEQAKTQGKSVIGALAGLSTAASVQTRLMGNPDQKRLSEAAADATSRWAESDSAKLLAAAYETGNNNTRAAIDTYLNKGDVNSLHNIINSARNNPALIRARNSANVGSTIMSKASPEIVQKLNAADAYAYAKRVGVKLPTTKALQQALASGNWSSFSPRAKDLLSPTGSTGGRLLGTLLGAGEYNDIFRTPKIKIPPQPKIPEFSLGLPKQASEELESFLGQLKTGALFGSQGLRQTPPMRSDSQLLPPTGSLIDQTYAGMGGNKLFTRAFIRSNPGLSKFIQTAPQSKAGLTPAEISNLNFRFQKMQTELPRQSTEKIRHVLNEAGIKAKAFPNTPMSYSVTTPPRSFPASIIPYLDYRPYISMPEQGYMPNSAITHELGHYFDPRLDLSDREFPAMIVEEAKDLATNPSANRDMPELMQEQIKRFGPKLDAGELTTKDVGEVKKFMTLLRGTGNELGRRYQDALAQPPLGQTSLQLIPEDFEWQSKLKDTNIKPEANERIKEFLGQLKSGASNSPRNLFPSGV